MFAVLFLVYLPSVSVHSGNALSNRTQNQVIKPIIGADTFVVQLLHAGYQNNGDVDHELVKLVCQDTKSFVSRNYIERVKTVLSIRQVLKAESVSWLGGTDVAAALAPLLQGEFKRVLNELDAVYCGELGYLVISPYHPSRPLNSRGDTHAVEVVRYSLKLFKAVQTCLRAQVECTPQNVIKELDKGEVAHQRMYHETRRMLTFILGPGLLAKVLSERPALLHYDSKNMLEALDLVSNSDHFFDLSDDDQRELFAKQAAKSWTDVDDIKSS